MKYKFAVKIGETKKIITSETGMFVFSSTSDNHVIRTKFDESEFGLGARKRHLELQPDEYGLKICGDVYDKDIVKFTDKAKKTYYGTATLNGCLEDFTRSAGVLSEDGVFFGFNEISAIEVVSSALVSSVSDFSAALNKDAPAAKIEAKNGSEEATEPQEPIPVTSPVTVYVRGVSNNSMCGYGIIIEKEGEIVKDASIKVGQGTGNLAELKAVYAGIRKAAAEYAPSYITVKASGYVVDGATKWYKGWIKNGWITKAGSPVVNGDLWKKIIEVNKTSNVKYELLKDEYEERLKFLSEDCLTEVA